MADKKRKVTKSVTKKNGVKTKTRTVTGKAGTADRTKVKVKGGGAKKKTTTSSRQMGGTHVGKGGDYTKNLSNVTTRTKTKKRGAGVTKKKTASATRVQTTDFTPNGVRRGDRMVGGHTTTKTRKGLRKTSTRK